MKEIKSKNENRIKDGSINLLHLIRVRGTSKVIYTIFITFSAPQTDDILIIKKTLQLNTINQQNTIFYIKTVGDRTRDAVGLVYTIHQDIQLIHQEAQETLAMKH